MTIKGERVAWRVEDRVLYRDRRYGAIELHRYWGDGRAQVRVLKPAP